METVREHSLLMEGDVELGPMSYSTSYKYLFLVSYVVDVLRGYFSLFLSEYFDILIS